jgi:hypothetical protein
LTVITIVKSNKNCQLHTNLMNPHRLNGRSIIL